MKFLYIFSSFILIFQLFIDCNLAQKNTNIQTKIPNVITSYSTNPKQVKWINLSNINNGVLSNYAQTEIPLQKDELFAIIEFRDFSFQIPENSVIKSINIYLERSTSFEESNGEDISLRIGRIDSFSKGIELIKTPSFWRGNGPQFFRRDSFELKQIPSDLSFADINSKDFGFILLSKRSQFSSKSPIEFYISVVEISVNYELIFLDTREEKSYRNSDTFTTSASSNQYKSRSFLIPMSIVAACVFCLCLIATVVIICIKIKRRKRLNSHNSTSQQSMNSTNNDGTPTHGSYNDQTPKNKAPNSETLDPASVNGAPKHDSLKSTYLNDRNSLLNQETLKKGNINVTEITPQYTSFSDRIHTEKTANNRSTHTTHSAPKQNLNNLTANVTSNKETNKSPSKKGYITNQRPLPPPYSPPRPQSVPEDHQTEYFPMKQKSKKFTLTQQHHWAIKYSDLNLGEELGRGAYGVVYYGTWHSTSVAVKVINTRFKLSLNRAEEENLKEEARIMVSLRPHPNLVMLLGIALPPGPFCIVTEYCTNGSLFTYLEKEPNVDRERIFIFIRGIAAGMLHLHSECNVVHRDLATRNVLLSSTLEPKICDFGMSRILEPTQEEQCTESQVGPLRHLSPESINQRSYSQKSDVWSFGICLIEIITAHTVYPNINPLQMATMVSTGELKPSLPEGFINEWRDVQDLVLKCTEFEAVDRPGFSEICKIVKHFT